MTGTRSSLKASSLLYLLETVRIFRSGFSTCWKEESSASLVAASRFPGNAFALTASGSAASALTTVSTAAFVSGSAAGMLAK